MAVTHTITLSQDTVKIPCWTILVEDRNLIAGIIAGSAGILLRLNYLGDQPQSNLYRITSDVDISSFRREYRVEEKKILNGDICYILRPGEYGAWITSDRKFLYDLYIFTSPSFIQGIISIANNFGVDFRDLLFKGIFGPNGITYTLEGYLMAEDPGVPEVLDADDVPDILEVKIPDVDDLPELGPE